MKKLLTITLLISALFFVSCSDEETDIDTNASGSEESEASIITATETCLYSNFTIEANSTVVINCLLNL